ncbi:MAG: hypothetical protein K6E36_12530 [Oscillospiraceae bacterium]|nr:hypothetical protein [Oscillospiraceae bacterium]
MRHSMLRRSAAVLCGAVLLLTGCAGGNSSSAAPAETLPYGSTLTHNVKASPSIQYDSRFLPEGAADAICRYYRAIQSQDVNLFIGVQYPLWHDYFLNEYLEKKYTDADILKNTNKSMRDFFGGNFRYSLIDVTDCEMNTTHIETESVVSVIDDLAQEQGLDRVSKDIDAFAKVTVTRYFTEPSSTHNDITDIALKDEVLYLMHHQQTWYVIYQ